MTRESKRISNVPLDHFKPIQENEDSPDDNNEYGNE